MAKLPTRQDLGDLPSTRGLREPVARINRATPRTVAVSTRAITEGVQDVARGLGNVADAAFAFEDRRRKQLEFDTEIRFQQFEHQQKQATDEAAKNMQPGAGAAFPGAVDAAHTEAGKAFLKSVPEELKDAYRIKLTAQNQNLVGAAQTIGLKEQKRFVTNQLTDTVSSAYTSRARVATTAELPDIISDMEGLVNASPLTPIEQDELNRSLGRIVELAHLGALDARSASAAVQGDTFKYLSAKDRESVIKKSADDVIRAKRAAELLNGALSIADPNNKEDRNAIDQAWEDTADAERLRQGDPAASLTLTSITNRTGILPDSALSDLRAMAANGNEDQKIYALQTTSNVMRRRPGVLEGRSGAKVLREDSQLFGTLVSEIGLSPDEALKRIERRKEPEFEAQRTAAKPRANELAKNLTKDDLTGGEFDGYFSSQPELGASPRRGDVLLNAFRENFKVHFAETFDEEAAKANALRDMKNTYDVSSLLGQNRLMKHPPEKHYPALSDGSMNYFTDQLISDVSAKAGKPIELENIFVEAIPQTDADIRAGRFPRYGVVWRDENGALQSVPGEAFRADPTEALKADRQKVLRKARLQREILMAEQRPGDSAAQASRDIQGRSLAELDIERTPDAPPTERELIGRDVAEVSREPGATTEKLIATTRRRRRSVAESEGGAGAL